MKKIIFLFFFSLVSLSLMAQEGEPELTDAQKRAFEKQAEKKVKLLTFYISGIVNKALESGTRDKYVRLAVGLFTETAKIQVSNSAGIQDVKVREYFETRIRKTYDEKFETTVIEYAPEAFSISSFEKDPNDPYVYWAVATFAQTFRAKKKGDSGVEINDWDRKAVNIKLQLDVSMYGVRWIMYLSDVTVQESRKLN
jgi:hypothetical protein